jgi:cysteine desulfurase/selenocysteine lyase
LIFCNGATSAINMTAFGLRKIVQPGDIILISEIEHNSNFLPWNRLAEDTNAFLEIIPWTKDGLDFRVLDYLYDRNIAVIGITHMSNATGYKPDLKKIIRFAKDKKAFTFLDIAQTSGHYRFDFQESEFDFAAVSAHKMYGPKGIGALIGKKDALEKLEPMNLGGGGIYSIENKSITYHTIPYRHEAGTINVPGIKAWSVACDYLSQSFVPGLLLKEKSLASYIRGNLKKIHAINVFDVGVSENSPIISFECENVHSHDLSDFLNAKNIAIRTGHLCAHLYLKALSRYSLNRISVGLYNTKEDAEYLLECIEHISKR